MFEGYETELDTSGKKLTAAVLNASFPDCNCDCPAACTTLEYTVIVKEGAPLDKRV